MSSLFSILSLFTEDIKLRHEDDEDGGVESSASSTGPGHTKSTQVPVVRVGSFTPDSGPQSPVHTPQTPPQPNLRNRRTSGLASPTAGGQLPIVPPLSLDMNGEAVSQGKGHCDARP